MVISRFVRMWFAGVCAALLATGCQFGAGGGDAGTDTDDNTSNETGTTDDGPTPGTNAVTTSNTTGSDDDDDATADPDPDSSTTASTAADDCEPFTLWLWAEDVADDDTTLNKTPAMELPLLDGESVTFLRSVQGGQGTAAFSFEMPCTATVRAMGLVWDAAEGIDNADAYLVGVDMDEAALETEGAWWHYGCATEARGWSWEDLSDDGEACEGPGPIEFMLEAGSHHLQIANREQVNNAPQYNFTGIAAIVITNDPTADPSAEYDPSTR